MRYLLLLLIIFTFGCTQSEASEEQAGATRVLDLNFEEIDLPERHYLVFRQRLPLAEMSGFLSQEAGKLEATAQRAGTEVTGPPTGLFYEWDSEAGMGEAAVALPVAPSETLNPYVMITLPAARALSLTVKGSYAGLSAAHFGLDSELKRRGLNGAVPTIEEYLVSPRDSVAPDSFLTRIFYPIENSH